MIKVSGSTQLNETHVSCYVCVYQLHVCNNCFQNFITNKACLKKYHSEVLWHWILSNWNVKMIMLSISQVKNHRKEGNVLMDGIISAMHKVLYVAFLH